MVKLIQKNKLLIVVFGLIISFISLYWIVSIKIENEIIKKAVVQYKKDKTTSGEPNVEYDENGMIVGDERFGNAGMPKTLVLEGVPILCFEWANMGDDSKCTKEQLDTIKAFFKGKSNLNWDKEYFNY